MNDVRLYLKVTYLSCMTNVEGNKIERWALFGPSCQDSELEWPVRRKPLPENMREWRQLIYENFTAATGLYPANLGSIWREVIRVIPVLEEEAAQANVQLENLEYCYKQLVGEFKYTTVMVEDFRKWAPQGTLYAGSDGSNINNFGAHGFGFTSGAEKTKIWGGAAETSGNIQEMTPLRSEHAGSIAIIIILHILQMITKV